MRKRFACFLAMLSVSVLVSACLDFELNTTSCAPGLKRCASHNYNECYIPGAKQCTLGFWQVCHDKQWVFSNATCCNSGESRCEKGYLQVCENNDWVYGGNVCIPCVWGQTRCQNDVSQVCENGLWVNGGSACKACTSGETRCDNAVSQVCKSGLWVNGGNACEACTSGKTRCQNYVSEICYNGEWVEGGNDCRCYFSDNKCDNGNLIVCNDKHWERTNNTCVCNDDETRCQNHASQICKDGQWVEGGYGCCDIEGQMKGSGHNPLTCINGAWSYACIDGSVSGDDWCNCHCADEKWQCLCTACAPEMKRCMSNQCNDATYPGVCVPNANYRSICRHGQIVMDACPDGTQCSMINNKPVCVCDASTYQGVCSDDLTRYSYCRNGEIVSAECPKGIQCSMLNNKPVCKTTTEDCAPGGTKYCNKACKSDKTEGYYYSKGEVHTIECPDADCEIRNYKVVCGGDDCKSDKDCMAPNIPSSCEYGVSKGLCGTDGMAYICGEEGKYYKNMKCTGNCYECGDGYWVACGEDEATACAGHDKPASDCQTLLTEGGNVGDCCDMARYVPSCETMLRCDKTGHVAAIECKDNTTCVLNTHGRKHNGYIYDQTKYPLGFYECI